MIRGVYPNHFHDIITLSHRKGNENYQIHKQSGNYFMFCMYLCTKQLITFLLCVIKEPFHDPLFRPDGLFA